MFGFLFHALGALLVWVWLVDPPVMTLLGLAVALGLAAVFAVPRGWPRVAYRRERWSSDLGEPASDPAREALSAEVVASVIPLRRNAREAA